MGYNCFTDEMLSKVHKEAFKIIFLSRKHREPIILFTKPL